MSVSTCCKCRRTSSAIFLGRYISDMNFIIKRQKSTYFVTTPIFYVNAKPHIGHLYTTLIADAVARFKKLKESVVQVNFMTGTDEHGLKISKSAEEHKMDELSYCNKISKNYQELFNEYNVCYTDFLRTTEDRHKETVIKLWNKIFENGYIYSGNYSGWYCVSDEAFITEVNLEPEKRADGYRYTKDLNRPTQFVEEVNYKFKLSHFKNDLLHWLKGEQVLKPQKFANIVEDWIETDEVMQDISVSRPANRVPWCIPVPNDPTQNIYVWLDALSSYLTSVGYTKPDFHWPPDVQVIGKDILKFHAIFWPAFLMAAGLEPPKCILCHSHWLNDGEKMSKSRGNVVDPMDLKLSSDGFRYYLLRTGVPHSDGNYCETEAVNAVNNELADKLGNLMSRCRGKTVNPRQIWPSYSMEHHNKYCKESAKDLIDALQILPDSVCHHFDNYNFYKGINEIMTAISLSNKFVDAEKPWVICKSQSEVDHLRIVLHFVFESLRVCGILLQPIVPGLSENILNQLGVKAEERTFLSLRPFSWQKNVPNADVNLPPASGVLFKKIK